MGVLQFLVRSPEQHDGREGMGEAVVDEDRAQGVGLATTRRAAVENLLRRSFHEKLLWATMNWIQKLLAGGEDIALRVDASCHAVLLLHSLRQFDHAR